ncbi:MAG: ATP-binding cassette domain-containing protein, partial [Planctomycetota bacterium]
MSNSSMAASAKSQPARRSTKRADDPGVPPLKLAQQPIMTVSGLRKSYYKGSIEVPVLKGVDLSINEGEFTAIVGQSGSGKSTL